MRPVNEKVMLPRTFKGTIESVLLFSGDLVKQLSSVFIEYGFRLNRVYPKDGTENANVMRITDGVSAPATTTGAAIIYVDSSSGDLMVKFGDGVTKTIAPDT